MKKNIINTIAALGIIAGLAASVLAPWWVVWFLCFPAVYAGLLGIIKINNIEGHE